MSVQHRQHVEARIALTAVQSLIQAGFYVTVNDGEDDVITTSQDLHAIAACMMSTDEDTLVATKPVGKVHINSGFVQLVYGNHGYDVISDYSVSLKEHLDAANKLALALGEGWHESDGGKVMKDVAEHWFPKKFRG